MGHMEGSSSLERVGPTPRVVRAIQAILIVDVLWAVVGTLTTLPLLIRFNQWEAALSPARPERLYAPVAGPQTHFSMLGSYSTGVAWVGLAVAMLVLLLLLALALLATRPSKWVAYVLGAFAVYQAFTLSVLGLLLIALVMAPSARSFYWRRTAPPQ
jgi:hypothetical protein